MPVAEHSSDQLERVSAPCLTGGVWRPANTSSSDTVFNGLIRGESCICLCDTEITNTQELKSHVESTGARLSTDGLAEIITVLVQSEGSEAFRRLRGSFSCAVFIGNRAFLAVDRFGMKRLNWLPSSNGLLFSSRVDSFKRIRRISPRAVAYYLNLSYVPSPEAIFEGVRKLQPGCCVRWLHNSQAKVDRYWEMTFPEDLTASEKVHAPQLRDLLRGAVNETLRGTSAKTTGCYLSGGTDSSSILGMTGRVLSETLPGYTVGFEHDDFSELQYARIASRHFGSKLSEFILRPDDAWAAVPKLVSAFDEPFGNPSALGGYHCALNARRSGTEVMLAGDGGDELFGGNERYRKDVIYSWIGVLPQFVIQNPVLSAFWSATSRSAASVRLHNIFKRAVFKNPERFYLEDCLSADLNGNFLTSDLANTIHSRTALEIVREYYQSAQASSELNRLLFIDLKMTIGDSDLVKVRQTASAAGVRVRYPMLDHPLAEFSGRIPACLKVKGLEKRYLFKYALRDFLPREILMKRKHGFGVPVSVWFRTDNRFRELLLDVTNDRVTLQRGFFHKERLRQMVDEHLRCFRDWGHTLWALLMLELWQREVERG
jgi:asparagine synthase (glutamine-hydrolysing)